MKALSRWSVLAFAALWAVQAQAQTADEIVERHLTALGGRAALAKLESQTGRGTISVSTQGVDISGSIEIYHKAPNKARSYSRLDLSQLGGSEVIVDTRCDGKAAFMSNSMQGDRDITGNQLQSMLNATFPTPLLAYKESGAKIELTGKDQVGDRAVYVLVYTPKVGLASRQYFDAENYQLLRVVAKVDIPELGGETEQTTDLQDYREVDGVKLPFTVHVVNKAQEVTIKLASVEHNKPVDDAMFSKPAK